MDENPYESPNADSQSDDDDLVLRFLIWSARYVPTGVAVMLSWVVLIYLVATFGD